MTKNQHQLALFAKSISDGTLHDKMVAMLVDYAVFRCDTTKSGAYCLLFKNSKDVLRTEVGRGCCEEQTIAPEIVMWIRQHAFVKHDCAIGNSTANAEEFFKHFVTSKVNGGVRKYN